MPRKGSIKIRKEQIDALCENIRNGVPNKMSCQSVGLAESTFYNYKQRAEEVLKNRKSKKSPQNLALAEFLERVKKAEADAVVRNVAIIQVAGQTSWTASAWWLERRYPNDFGRFEKVETITKDSNEELRKAEEKRLETELGIVFRKSREVKK